MKSFAFHFSPKVHHVFGLLLIETMSSRTFKNRPIWRHWLQEPKVGRGRADRPKDCCHLYPDDDSKLFAAIFYFRFFGEILKNRAGGFYPKMISDSNYSACYLQTHN